MTNTTSPSSQSDTLLTDQALMAGLQSAIADKLQPHTTAIDREGMYPENFLRYIGRLGAYAQAVAPQWGGTGRGILGALRSIEMVAQECGSTGFMTWCHNACAWYLHNSDNLFLHREILPKVARGSIWQERVYPTP